MTATREQTIEWARASLESGDFVRHLAAMVAVPSESQIPERHPELGRYLAEVVAPMLTGIGFEIAIHPNPRPAFGPILLAQRIEDPDRPTILLYGHGDVVNGQAPTWRAGLDPWSVATEGGRIYGRGTADNKGQHLIAIEALRAVLAGRPGLGFNARFIIETGEEVGSPGLRDFVLQNREACAADVFIGLDGPRQSTHVPEMRLGARGGVTFDLRVALRKGNFHSGHWGGVLPDAGVILAHALASIISAQGEVLVDGWRPPGIPASVRDACRAIRFEDLPGLPEVDPAWGEPDLSKAEKIYAWTSAVILAFKTGNTESPVNAVQGEAWARVQVRHDVELAGADIMPALRRHLDARGFGMVSIHEIEGREMFPASRTDPAAPWVRAVGASMARTTGQAPNVVPNSSGGNPSEFFRSGLGIPVIWIPNSYAASGQHAADEHLLVAAVGQGLEVMAGLFWDLGQSDFALPD